MAPVGGLRTHRCDTQDISLLWAANPRVPVSHVADAEGLALLLGDAWDDKHADCLDAAAVRSAWDFRSDQPLPAFDGFHVAVVAGPRNGVLVGADILGLLPVYYFEVDDVLVVGSSIALFRHHPIFQTELNPAGLAGVLLAGHMVNGETLLKGVRRLDAGRVLARKPAQTTEERLQFQLPVSEKFFELPFSVHVELLESALENAIKRSLPRNGRVTLMLSGGLDSRLIAGFLAPVAAEASAFTLGRSADIEMQCAARVAHTLGLRQRISDLESRQYPRWAECSAIWEQLATGFNGIYHWGSSDALDEPGERLVMGHSLDAAIGSRYLDAACQTGRSGSSFDALFRRLNQWGFSPDTLGKLLRGEMFGDCVEDACSRLRARFENYAPNQFQRVWCYNLQNRQRFHVGGAAWVHAFRAWPVLPVLNRNLLAVAGGMSAATLAERLAQEALLCRRFASLAALPLDRNSYETDPLQPRFRWMLGDYVKKRLPFRNRRKSGRRAGERRFYYRVYDFNGDGWRGVRRAAEPLREKVRAVFDPQALDEILPKPAETKQFQDGIIEASGMKSLLGFMLWSRENL